MKRKNWLKLTADSGFHTKENVKMLTYLESVFKLYPPLTPALSHQGRGLINKPLP
jgi:hypothetical protein